MRPFLLDQPTALFVVGYVGEVIYGILAVREAFASVLEVYPSLYRRILWGPPRALNAISGISLWQVLLHHPAGPIFMACLGTFAHWFMLGVLGLEGACSLPACDWLSKSAIRSAGGAMMPGFCSASGRLRQVRFQLQFGAGNGPGIPLFSGRGLHDGGPDVAEGFLQR